MRVEPYFAIYDKYSNMNSNLKKYALVTGGSSGMGLEYVKSLARRGYNVIIVALFQEETDRVKEMMSELYPNLDFISIGMDLSTMEAPVNLYEKVREMVGEGSVEVLINNAGVINPMHFRNMTSAQISRIIMLHNHTTAMLCHYFLPSMLSLRKGYILNISSLAAWFSFPYITTYASTKAFTKVFTRALRTECAGSGVKVASIYFGAVDTPLYNLSKGKRRLARGLGVMITPQKASERALRMLFGGFTGWMPGLINKIAYIVTPLLRPCIVAQIDKAVTKHWNFK